MDPKSQPPTNSSDDPLAPNLPEEFQSNLQPPQQNDSPSPTDAVSSDVPQAQSMPTPGQSFGPSVSALADQPGPGSSSPVVPQPAAQSTVPVATTPAQSEAPAQVITETPDLPAQPPALNKRIFTPPPEELLRKPSHKKRNSILIVVILLILAATGAYFGYYVPNKPENMWKSALVNTGKGYDQLIKQTEATKEVQGWSQQGTFDVNGIFEADGSIKGQSSGNTSKTTGSISALGTKVNFDVRTLPSNTETPDMYFKVDGLDGIGSLLSQDDPEIEAALNGLNNQWYVIDHTLFEQLESAQADPSQSITAEDATALFKAFGVTSKEYVFTDDSENAVVVIKDKIGKEKKHGRSVYHYTVDANDKQAEKYITELCKDLKSSKIGKVMTSSMGGEDVLDCDQSTKRLQGDLKLEEADLLNRMPGSPSDSQSSGELVVDAWVDTKTKLIQSLRFSNTDDKKTYVEISQNFTGGDKMPFKFEFYTGSETPTKLILEATYDTKTQSIDTKGNFSIIDQSNDENSASATFKFTMQPSKGQPTVERPADAKNIIELLNILGVGDLFAEAGPLFGGTQSRAEDTVAMNDLRNVQVQLETYYNDNGYYPSLAYANKEKWVDSQFAEAASANSYGYSVRGEAGDSCAGESCQVYELTALLSSGEMHTLKSIN